MITAITIHNYALIDHVQVDFTTGLTTLTGETGAGKSILLDALSLVLGKRADLSSVKEATKKCYVEAHIAISNYELQSLFEVNGLDYDPQTILRRELLPGGKSRAFVNDSPVTLSQLQAVSGYLIDIHSQHETLSLFSESFQLELLDTLADNQSLLNEFSVNRKKYISVSDDLEKMIHQQALANKEQDYNLFLLQELQNLSLSTIDQEALEEQLETLSHAELIQQSLGEVTQLLSQETIGTLETVKEARLILDKIKSFSKKHTDLWERLHSVVIELEDIYNEAYFQAEQVEINPEALEQVNQTLKEVVRLQQKHSVASVKELIDIQTQLEQKINQTEAFEEQINELRNSKKHLEEHLYQLAGKIRTSRQQAIPVFTKQVTAILSKIGLPNAQFDFKLTQEQTFKTNGMDSLQLLFTANKGMPFQALKKVASGGELSRIMLAVKAVLSNYKKLPTLILDEIDTGVSGEIAHKIGEVMKEMSRSMQLIVITHLPQIASKGATHIKIFKQETPAGTTTQVKTLTKEERVVEIATMIGGDTQTQTAINHAKELLN